MTSRHPRRESDLPDVRFILDELRTAQPSTAEAAERAAKILLEGARGTPFAALAVIAQQGTGADALRLGEAMIRDAEVTGSPDFGQHGWCWIEVAAARGNEPAIEKMSSANGEMPAPTATSRRTRVDELRKASEEAVELTAEVGDTFAEPPPGDTVLGRCVVQRIGDEKSRDGQELLKRFKHAVGRELPFAGRLPAAKATADAILKRWPWATQVARFVEGQTALMRQSGAEFVRLPPLLFVGETGGGKTSLALEMAKVLGLHSTPVPCGGVSDSGGLSATGRGWATQRPCAPFLAIAESGTPNPMIVLDELDKGTDSRSQNGSVWAAALAMLEKSERYQDPCLLAEVDLSCVSFIATANDASVLPPELSDRFLILRVPRPRPCDFDTVLDNTVRDVARLMGTEAVFLPDIEWDERAFLAEMLSKKQQSLRSFRKAVMLLLGEKATSEEMVPRLLH